MNRLTFLSYGGINSRGFMIEQRNISISPDNGFFRRETLERIQKRGGKSVDLVGFFSAYGLQLFPDRVSSVVQLLNGQEGLTGVIKNRNGRPVFASREIFKVTQAIESISVRNALDSAVIGGVIH